MKRQPATSFVLFLFAAVSLMSRAGAADAQPLRWRWVFIHGASLSVLDEKVLDVAAAHGFNGLALANNIESLSEWPRQRLDALQKLKRRCDDKNVELIPVLFSAGYGGWTLRRDKNLSAGIPVRDVLFEVKGGAANVAPERPITLSTGGFERYKGHQVEGLGLQDRPGFCTFVDTRVAKEGRASLRFENFDNMPGNHARIRLPTIRTRYKHYILRFWARASGLQPAKIKVEIDTENGPYNFFHLPLKNDAGWKKFEIAFCTQGHRETKVFLGVWGAKRGKFWIDAVEVFEPGLVDVLRRSGTPLVVKQDGGPAVYTEGVDFQKIVDPGLLQAGRHYHTPPAIRIIRGGRIQEGDRLRVSYYTPPRTNVASQMVLCMSEPKVYQIWQGVIEKVHAAIRPKTWLLSMDEIRGGGTCQACRKRKRPDGSPMTPGEILGDCISRQMKMIRAASPNAEIAIWSDMLDPYHNAVKNYYSVPGGYVGSWKHVPKDLIIACWNNRRPEKSLAHFSGLGFRTMGLPYMGSGGLDHCRQWVARIHRTPKGAGIIYVSYTGRFPLLAECGDLIYHRR